jgi:hypothetical protein
VRKQRARAIKAALTTWRVRVFRGAEIREPIPPPADVYRAHKRAHTRHEVPRRARQWMPIVSGRALDRAFVEARIARRKAKESAAKGAA